MGSSLPHYDQSQRVGNCRGSRFCVPRSHFWFRECEQQQALCSQCSVAMCSSTCGFHQCHLGLAIMWPVASQCVGGSTGFQHLPPAALPAVPRPLALPCAAASLRAGYSSHVEVESTSFVRNIFNGQLVPTNVFPFPSALTEEETQSLQTLLHPCTRFFEEVNNPAANEKLESIEEATLAGLKDLGAFGLQVPVELGGTGLKNSQVRSLLARALCRWGCILSVEGTAASRCCCPDPPAARRLARATVGARRGTTRHVWSRLRPLPQYARVVDPEQKEKYTCPIASGEAVAAFCLTEPTSGSDAASIRTVADLSPCGRFYTLNGEKIWISNGGIAEIFTVFAKTPIKVETGEMKERISAFIVERAFGGVTSGPPEKKMGIKCSNTAQVHFDNVKVPAENLLGGLGKGFKVAMNILNNGRFGMVSALAGTMRGVIVKAADHAANRTQFGDKISNYGAIQEKIARMAMLHYVTESMAYVLSANMDMKVPDYKLEAAISKIFASEAAWHVTDEVIQVLGGMGYMQEAGIEKIMRDLRIFRIFEGTNDILRLFVALTGVQYAGSCLKNLQKRLMSPLGNVRAVLREVGWRAKRKVGISSGFSLQGLVHSDLNSSAVQLTTAVDLLGEAVESLLLTLGARLPDKQFHLKRVADAAIDMYAMAVVLSRASRALTLKLVSAEHEKLLCRTWCQEAYERVKANLRAVKSSTWNQSCSNMKLISHAVVQNKGVYTTHPLDICRDPAL
ncbi:PREDICTED: very long-chain specific acyl-CoA dehydrogenase, mitochondrial [Tinamus guttatus]|uniref:very long-chain specific acyl-CoA dehydrogenase, mitochondrial n=1 Tax=Tinamus guttatus TaxID=94827 RepID=UPI00052F3DF9|nr:PREDICTED: very long-chain specific acyl-CoA dehydrogenase, mitochondrial [Tinamus guttatus]